MATEDVHKTDFVTPDGQYEFTRMPFGMVNSLFCNNLYIVCILVICILCMVDIVDIALCVCRLLLYNNFKRGVMSQFNVTL